MRNLVGSAWTSLGLLSSSCIMFSSSSRVDWCWFSKSDATAFPTRSWRLMMSVASLAELPPSCEMHTSANTSIDSFILGLVSLERFFCGSCFLIFVKWLFDKILRWLLGLTALHDRMESIDGKRIRNIRFKFQKVAKP
ncbi:hypothetical protein DVH05_017212 [Phytophthora capsici]|nr:hypothetical protein DVH05_017212 [Phytophthora capsici]